MKKSCFVLLTLFVNLVYAQSLPQKLEATIKQMEDDASLRHAVIGFCVADGKTGKIVYEHHAQTGLAPASTQKIFTSCAAFDLLGKDYRYTTEIGYNKWIADSSQGYFSIRPSGDPSFGSSRYASTKPVMIWQHIVEALQEKKIRPVASFVVNDTGYETNAVPGGWIWEDVGNYYGAPAQQFNWLENQYDIVLASGKSIGDKVSIVATKPADLFNKMYSHVTSAEKGSGDKTVVYLPYGSDSVFINGTIPVNENAFAVSASITKPAAIFQQQLTEQLKLSKTIFTEEHAGSAGQAAASATHVTYTELYKHLSPPLDSLNYWFLKKSINLYGEALIKTMAFEKSRFGSTEKGVALLKDFWSEHGIEKSALHICDGSGLSPQNRVTPDALVKALQYAKTRPWFSSFYYDLPEYNGMKMKSGSISGARAYAGYQKAVDGNEYIFSIIINNYDGPAAETIKKMYKLLDNLK